MAQFADDNAVIDFIDQNGITSFIDQNGIFLGPEGVLDIHGTLGVTEARDTASFSGVTILLSQVVLGDHVLDNGLIVLSTEANAFWLCSGDPTGDYGTANGLRRGNKSGVPFGAPEIAIDGSSVFSIAILDGAGIANGLCTHWAAVDTVNLRVLARGPLMESAPISIGQMFRLPSFHIFVQDHEV